MNSILKYYLFSNIYIYIEFQTDIIRDEFIKFIEECKNEYEKNEIIINANMEFMDKLINLINNINRNNEDDFKNKLIIKEWFSLYDSLFRTDDIMLLKQINKRLEYIQQEYYNISEKYDDLNRKINELLEPLGKILFLYNLRQKYIKRHNENIDEETIDELIYEIIDEVIYEEETKDDDDEEETEDDDDEEDTEDDDDDEDDDEETEDDDKDDDKETEDNILFKEITQEQVINSITNKCNMNIYKFLINIMQIYLFYKLFEYVQLQRALNTFNTLNE
jgi:hypothetical protein